ncbi:MAG TPA: hypothetical protein VN436_11450, partial [Holophaga sp.]|nr:hypothetical protein [Holophaga sp.]
GLGFLSRCAVEMEVGREELQILDLPGVDIRRRFSWVVPPGGLPRGVDLFRRLVQEGEGATC